MAGNVCPTCNSSIDPARAPVARIRGARVLTFCSAECAEADGLEPVRPAADEPAGGPDPIPGQRARGVGAWTPEPSARTSGTGEAGDPARAVALRPRGSRRRQIIALSAAIMMGGMVITIINAISPSTPSDVSAAGHRNAARGGDGGHAPATTAHPAAAMLGPGVLDAEPVAEPITAEELLQRATRTLHELLDSPSARVKRIAAMALSRVRDERAVAHLNSLLDAGDDSLMGIEAAYALARIGDDRAREILYKSLAHSRRDIRVDAARSLIQLRDKAGGKVLRRMLSLRTHRLGAAEYLARIDDRDGLSALREALASSKTSEETRMRALVALGRAGKQDVREDLRAILRDGRYQLGAAAALAALGDRDAVEPLSRQLGIASLRVRAALALRRLHADVELDALAAALDHGGDQARVSAAEAALVLAGPEALAEFD